MKAKQWFKEAERFVRSYTQGMDGGDFQRLFDRDAARAYGVVETLDSAGESFGFDRLREILAAGGSSRAVHDRVLRELDLFRGQEPVYDDRSLAVMTRSES